MPSDLFPDSKLALEGALAHALAREGVTARGLTVLLPLASGWRCRWAGGGIVALDHFGQPLLGRHGVPEGAARAAADLRNEYPEFFDNHHPR